MSGLGVGLGVAGIFASFLDTIAGEFTSLIDSGGLVQWRKYPNTFFVEGVDKARISWDFKKGVLSHKYLSSIADPEQRKKFAKAYNTLHTALGTGSGKDGK